MVLKSASDTFAAASVRANYPKTYLRKLFMFALVDMSVQRVSAIASFCMCIGVCACVCVCIFNKIFVIRSCIKHPPPRPPDGQTLRASACIGGRDAPRPRTFFRPRARVRVHACVCVCVLGPKDRKEGRKEMTPIIYVVPYVYAILARLCVRDVSVFCLTAMSKCRRFPENTTETRAG